ncbi:uncharacterized protein FOMMEDRAFT_163238 [Fomitiporia mediterranea MF3/22]|uniref:Uncharacterized protein n=1 Tax=Fomitiporia mediterranea (strain MF3/22) TaxID=694068 RepID=R7SGM9_FOMME|nr:uncharacterized protein FOMMEDRAFT_163238 [Fomitiporia mediterranea MF3/22]EJC97462.1 hypothetical protein FOMMEDRAFT_163238 [Fomitiporia mediterranea MF3/22]
MPRNPTQKRPSQSNPMVEAVEGKRQSKLSKKILEAASQDAPVLKHHGRPPKQVPGQSDLNTDVHGDKAKHTSVWVDEGALAKLQDKNRVDGGIHVAQETKVLFFTVLFIFTHYL